MINVKNSVRGFYIIEKFKGVARDDGTIEELPGSRERKAEFENLILDQGLDRMGTNSIRSCLFAVHVGSGSAVPNQSDTQLQNFIAASNTSQSVNGFAQSATPPYYIAEQVVKRFAEGAAQGNLSEVGIGWGLSGSTLFSRSLIKDVNGDPTTITVGADEYLDVLYELRIYPDTADMTGVVSIGGLDYDYVARPARISNVSYWDVDDAGSLVNPLLCRAYAGSLGDVFGVPSGGSDFTSSNSSSSYSSGSYQIAATLSWDLNGGNIGGIRSVLVVVGFTAWQIEFTQQGTGDPIPKDATNLLDVTLTYGWGRAA